MTIDAQIKDIIGRKVSANIRLNETRYHKERDLLIADLLEPGLLDTVAIHEAGHEYYFTKAGAYNFVYVRPVILFEPKDSYRPFKKQIARIKIGGHKDISSSDSKWFLKLAMGYVAGGECSKNKHFSLSNYYCGDLSDRKRWNEMCGDCYKSASIATKELKRIEEGTWNDAQKAVREDLEDPAVQSAILNKAAEIKPQLFPWIAETRP